MVSRGRIAPPLPLLSPAATLCFTLLPGNHRSKTSQLTTVCQNDPRLFVEVAPGNTLNLRLSAGNILPFSEHFWSFLKHFILHIFAGIEPLHQTKLAHERQLVAPGLLFYQQLCVKHMGMFKKDLFTLGKLLVSALISGVFIVRLCVAVKAPVILWIISSAFFSSSHILTCYLAHACTLLQSWVQPAASCTTGSVPVSFHL